MSRLLMDLGPLRASPPYRRMWAGTALSGIGTSLTTVAVGLQVYAITGSTFHVGLVGLFAVVPLIALGLYGGSIVDAYDRRRVVITTSVGLLLVAVAFAVQAWFDVGRVGLLYALVAVQNGLFAVNNPARTSIVPRLLPIGLLPAANALTGLSMGLAYTVGPLLAGLLVGWWGYAATYAVEVGLLTVALATLIALPPVPPEGTVRRAGLASVWEGLRFLGTRPNVRMTFLVDLAAMVLAMPRVLFPAIGATALGGGATTVGVLTAGIAFGMVTANLLSGPLGGVRRQGQAVLTSVVVWGAAIAVFGLIVAAAPGPAPGGGAHPMLWAAVAVLVVAGAADAVSGVFRMTILQAATPDGLRGRLQGVFIVVVAGGPQLGQLVLGSTAQFTGEALAAVAGGLACVAVVVALARYQPAFAHYDARDPTP
ncbi:MFS transporter [Solwaraspora sp. WMMD406]|uniref:MFS transporter n=1 Tax=Solwaraspora sp. WMMD406 TaxID=3016095 RepID=UPI002415B7B8|nr:MFS transporter [Solwaraspora sp. WMMD406]MDG4764591.1 MFS transporter [Solwaraspora sp. WMMD406]